MESDVRLQPSNAADNGSERSQVGANQVGDLRVLDLYSYLTTIRQPRPVHLGQ